MNFKLSIKAVGSIRRIAVAVVAMLMAVTAVFAQDNGFNLGVTGRAEIHGGPERYWTVGVQAGYHFNLPLCFYVEPSVSLSAGESFSRFDGPAPEGRPAVFMSGINVLGGVKLGKGWSFVTGPTMGVLLAAGQRATEPERVSLSWRFGLNKNFGRVYIRAMYSQGVTEEFRYHKCNSLDFGVGYRF